MRYGGRKQLYEKIFFNLVCIFYFQFCFKHVTQNKKEKKQKRKKNKQKKQPIASSLFSHIYHIYLSTYQPRHKKTCGMVAGSCFMRIFFYFGMYILLPSLLTVLNMLHKTKNKKTKNKKTKKKKRKKKTQKTINCILLIFSYTGLHITRHSSLASDQARQETSLLDPLSPFPRGTNPGTCQP